MLELTLESLRNQEIEAERELTCAMLQAMTESSQATRSRENTLFLTAFASCASPIATSSNTSFHEQHKIPGTGFTLHTIYTVEEEFAGCHRNQFPSHS
jgi:hypothetical protein